jgi:hypothetical protein
MQLAGTVGVLMAALGSAVVLAACGTVSGTPGASQSATGEAALASSPSTSHAAHSRRSQPGTRDGHDQNHHADAAGTNRNGRMTQAPVPGGRAASPSAQAVSTAHPDHVIGNGTQASCTWRAVVRAVAAGGVIRFSCGPRPVTIMMSTTAKVRNASARVVLDGGGKVTLSGGGVRRILYMDTCDPAQVWTTSHCQDQSSPVLIVQNLTFADGNSAGQLFDGGGGGAIFDRGGQLKIIDSRFTGNRCDPAGPDLGGAAIRALSQYQDRPVYVVGSTFQGGVCSNGGALSSIGVSWVVQDSIFTGNQAIGSGANPARAGTPGGGSGGAIYTDGDNYTVTIDGTVIAGNSAREGGGAVFFVSNDRTGTLRIERSRVRGNPSAGFQTAGYPGIFFLGRGHPIVMSSILS